MNGRRLFSGTLAAALAATTAASVAPHAAYADGAASTRNIIFGAAAVGAGTLLIINHNKKVHEKYAEYDRRQAETQAEANNAEAAYQSEQQAYSHEAAINAELNKEVAYQHHVVAVQQRQIASLEHSLRVAKANGSTGAAVAQQAAPSRSAPSQMAAANPTVTYGWGTY